MTRRRKTWFLAGLTVLVAGGCGVWYWYYRPVHQRRVLIESTLTRAAHDFGNAEKTLLRLHEEQPENTAVLEALARGTAQNPLELLRAEAFYTKLIEIQPERHELLLERAQVLANAKLYGRAAADFRAYLDHFPKEFLVRMKLVDCLMNDGDMEAAEDELMSLKKERPGDPAVLVGLGICVRARDLAQSKALLQQASEKDPSPWILNALGNTLLLLKDYDQAISVFERILKASPNDRRAHFKLAVALRRRNRESDKPEIEKHEKRYQELEREFEDAERRRAGLFAKEP
jgi:tetratricopeptide (TPR) repeat protein